MQVLYTCLYSPHSTGSHFPFLPRCPLCAILQCLHGEDGLWPSSKGPWTEQWGTGLVSSKAPWPNQPSIWLFTFHYQEESWAPNNWCFWTVVLEKTLESPLDCKEIQPVHPKENQSWIFIVRTDAKSETPILWHFIRHPIPDAKNWLIGKDPDAGKDWRREEKGMTEDDMVGWHHWLNGHEFE